MSASFEATIERKGGAYLEGMRFGVEDVLIDAVVVDLPHSVLGVDEIATSTHVSTENSIYLGRPPARSPEVQRTYTS